MSELTVVESSKSISDAWAQSFKKIYDDGDISPLVISVTGFSGDMKTPEDTDIRIALDISLKELNESSVQTVANTIFPWSLWNKDKPREELYERHDKILPSIRSCDANKRGHYFRRMISFDKPVGGINQLEKVFDVWDSSHRHSGLQVAFFDPNRDHIRSPYLGFPCLHQISFDCYGANGADGMGITAFYGTQHNHRKAYGNLLGLSRLGMFMAHEMDLEFVRLNCVSGLAKFSGSFRKTNEYVEELVELIESKID